MFKQQTLRGFRQEGIQICYRKRMQTQLLNNEFQTLHSVKNIN